MTTTAPAQDPALRSAVEKRASSSLRSLIARNEELEQQLAAANEKIASYEKRDRVASLVDGMEEKGLLPGLTREEKLAKVASAPDLDIVERAVDYAAQGGTKIAELADVPHGGGGSSEDAFLQFCLTGDTTD